MKRKFSKQLISFILVCVMLIGILPMQTYASSTTDDFVNEVDGNTFTLPGHLCDLVTSHNLYGVQDYLAYTWMDEFSIWFFDDLTDVNIYSWDKGYGCFGLAPSEDVTFTVYLYDLETLELKSVTELSLLVSNLFSFQFVFAASFDIYTDNTYTEYFYEAIPLPELEQEEPSEDIVTFVDGRTFTMEGKYVDILENNALYESGAYEYVAYVYNDEFSIMFFDDDFTNVSFNIRSKGAGRFALVPSRELTFTRYIYNKNTLEPKDVIANLTLAPTNAYTFSYEFMASFIIRWNANPFYNPVGETPPLDVVNVTNGKTFTMKGQYYDFITEDARSATKEYIAYVSNEELIVWFFDDLSNTKLRVTNTNDDSFEIRSSNNASYEQSTYDKASLQHKITRQYALNTSNTYSFGYEFIASFDIYTDTTYTECFYLSSNSIDKPLIEFPALAQQDAKDFLRFISNSDEDVNIEEKLPDYYNLLIGNISDPEEKFDTTISFLTYCYYCLDFQLAQSNERLELSTTKLMEWVGSNDDVAWTIYSNVVDEIVTNLAQTIALNYELPPILPGSSFITTILNYGGVLINAVTGFDAVRNINEVKYLLAYKRLFEAQINGDQYDIVIESANCEMLADNLESTGGDVAKIESFSRYLLNIELNFWD